MRFFAIFLSLEHKLKSFLKIAYNDSLRQWLTSSRGETHEKNLGGSNLGRTGQNRVQN